jgi:hypothetical protein
MSLRELQYLQGSTTLREAADNLDKLWTRDKEEIEKEHKQNLETIAAGNAEPLKKYQSERDNAPTLEAAEKADAKLARLADKWQGEVSAENKTYEERKQAVDREFANMVKPIEQGLSQLDELEQRHARERDGYDRLMEEGKDRSNVSAEQRVGDWVRTIGPIAEKAFNHMTGYEVQVEWNAVGDATEVALGQAKAKYGLPLYNQNELDQMMAKGVQEIQKQEMTQENFKHIAQLDVKAEDIQVKLQQDLGINLDKDRGGRQMDDPTLNR